MDGQGRTADLGDTDKNITHVIDPGGDLAREKAAYGGPVITTADCLSAAILHKDTGAPVIVVPASGHLPARAADIHQLDVKSQEVAHSVRTEKAGPNFVGQIAIPAEFISRGIAQISHPLTRGPCDFC